jgi:hypothetical protein
MKLGEKWIDKFKSNEDMEIEPKAPPIWKKLNFGSVEDTGLESRIWSGGIA